MVKKYWYQLNHALYIKELVIIEREISYPEVYISKTGNLCVQGIIEINNIKQPFRLLYPYTYPYAHRAHCHMDP